MEKTKTTDRVKRLTKICLTVAFAACCALLVTSTAHAEGSAELAANGGYRAYIEWTPALSSVGIVRCQQMNTYVKAGESVCFGSSVLAAADGRDIVVTAPDGTETVYDVTQAAGYIATVSQESAGPKQVGSMAGYTALTFTARQTGLYGFAFHSAMSGSAETNPDSALVTEQWTQSSQHTCVAAWDITVLNAAGEKQDGRSFTYYLTMNTGKNKPDGTRVMEASVYVLTDDGFLYLTDFNGMDPYGFIYYANNRGLIDPRSNTCLYHSAVATDNSFSRVFCGIIFPRPQAERRGLDVTHRIFINEPDDELLTALGLESPRTKINATGFAFDGGAVGAGGYFTFNLSADASYQVDIDLGDLGGVTIANAGVKGENRIFWDGKDAAGKVVGEGDFSATLTLKGGEYHFPLIDVENMEGGVRIELLNAPDIDGFNPDMLYYDNTDMTIGEETAVFSKNSSNFNGTLCCLEGVDSSDGVFSYSGHYGDLKIFDLWTYCPLSRVTADFSLTQGGVRVMIDGFVFFDTNGDGVYNIESGEYGLAGVTVEIAEMKADEPTKQEGGSVAGAVLSTRRVLTDASGFYSLRASTGAAVCKLSVYAPDGRLCTTDNLVQSVDILGNVRYSAGRVGLTVLNNPIPDPVPEPDPVPDPVPDTADRGAVGWIASIAVSVCMAVFFADMRDRTLRKMSR